MDSRVRVSLEHSYVWTAGLLILHQIDSAYWQETAAKGPEGPNEDVRISTQARSPE